jgi:hypothetical protein
MTDDDFPTTAMRQKAGHQEILGETLAKFEFFQKGWHPYSRFLDIDKVDLILRRRLTDKIVHREVQVKFGKLYTRMSAWEHEFFTCSSWRFFTEKDLDDMTERVGLFLAYVLSRDEGFKGDILIFPINDFVEIVRSSHKSGTVNIRSIFRVHQVISRAGMLGGRKKSSTPQTIKLSLT